MFCATIFNNRLNITPHQLRFRLQHPLIQPLILLQPRNITVLQLTTHNLQLNRNHLFPFSRQILHQSLQEFLFWMKTRLLRQPPNNLHRLIRPKIRQRIAILSTEQIPHPWQFPLLKQIMNKILANRNHNLQPWTPLQPLRQQPKQGPALPPCAKLKEKLLKLIKNQHNPLITPLSRSPNPQQIPLSP